MQDPDAITFTVLAIQMEFIKVFEDVVVSVDVMQPVLTLEIVAMTTGIFV